MSSKLQKKGVPRHAGDPCPDPGVHQAGAAANSSLYGSNPSLASRESVLGPDGRLSAAGAAASLKYARPQDLPSFPSLGLYDSNGTTNNAGKAASLANEKGGKLNLWQYQGSEYGHSAANLAVKNPASPSYGDFGYNEAEKKKALQAATMSYNKGSRAISGIKTPHNPLSDTMSDAGLEASRFTHQHALGPQMFTEHPVIPVSQEAQKYQDQIRAAAVSMARRMYELERNKPSAKEARGSSIGSQPQTYIGLEEMAKKLAAERLAALDPDGVEAYRDHYGFGRGASTQRQSMGARTFRTNSSSQVPQAEGRNLDVDSDDEAQAQKVRGQMSGLRGQLADIDEKKRQNDRDNLMAAAERLVKARLKNIDEQVFADTGKVPPSVAKEWEEQARAKATADAAAGNEKRALTSGKVHLGFGRYMDQTEIDAIASARMQPVLDEISETAEKQRQRDEEIRIAEAERKAAEEEEKRRLQNEKDAQKLRLFEEKQERDKYLAIEKAERDRVKGEEDVERRRLRDEKKAEKDRIKLQVYNDKQHEKSERKRIEAEQRAERERIAAEERAEREKRRQQELEERRQREAEEKERQAQLKVEQEEQARIKAEEDAEAARVKAEEDAARTAEEKEAAYLKEEEDAKRRLQEGEASRLAGTSETTTATSDREMHHLPESTGLADDAAEEKTIRPSDQMPPFMKAAEMAALTAIATNNGEVVGATSTPVVKTTTDEAGPGVSTGFASSSGIANEPTETGEAFTEVSKPTDEEMSASRAESTSQPLTATSSAATTPVKQSRRKSFFSRFKRSSKLKQEDKAMEQAKASAPVDGPGIVGAKAPVSEEEEPWEPAAGEETADASEVDDAVDPTTTAHHTTEHAITSTTAADDAALYNEPEAAEHAGELTPKANKGKEPVYPHNIPEDGRISPLEDDDDTIERGRSVVSETDDDTFEEARTNQDAASELSVPHAGFSRHSESSPARSASKFQEEL